MFGHLTVARSDLNPAIGFIAGRWNQRLPRYAYRPRDLFAPVQISEEMLAETLASHPGTV
jgi:hypothetical protein